MLFEIDITFTGKMLSTNQLLSAGTWKARKGLVDRYKREFKLLILANYKPQKRPFKQYKVKVEFRNKLDTVNNASMLKIFEDALQDLRFIENDTSKNNIFTILQSNLDLKPNSIRFVFEFI